MKPHARIAIRTAFIVVLIQTCVYWITRTYVVRNAASMSDQALALQSAIVESSMMPFLWLWWHFRLLRWFPGEPPVVFWTCLALANLALWFGTILLGLKTGAFIRNRRSKQKTKSPNKAIDRDEE